MIRFMFSIDLVGNCDCPVFRRTLSRDKNYRELESNDNSLTCANIHR